MSVSAEDQAAVTEGPRVEAPPEGTVMNRFIKAYRFFLRAFVAAAAVFLAAMMFITVADIVLRYALKRPIIGAYEIVESMMACAVSIGVAYCAYKRDHIVVDVIFDRLPKQLQNILAVLTNLVTVVFLVLLTWQNILSTIEMWESQLTSTVLFIPQYPFVGVVAVGFILFSLFFISDAVKMAGRLVRK